MGYIVSKSFSKRAPCTQFCWGGFCFHTGESARTWATLMGRLSAAQPMEQALTTLGCIKPAPTTPCSAEEQKERHLNASSQEAVCRETTRLSSASTTLTSPMRVSCETMCFGLHQRKFI